MGQWLDTSNSALWIYGIPGAGKTILSSLVIDEVLTVKRGLSVATAYFYIQYDDPASQITSNVLGSLISQLARQNTAALAEVVEIHHQCASSGGLPRPPNDDELADLLRSVSRQFQDTYILVDGLDECKTIFDPLRTALVRILSELHKSPTSSIRTIIFSRDESDIRNVLRPSFQAISITATSADLRLFVNAKVGDLKIKNVHDCARIVETLVEKAHGM